MAGPSKYKEKYFEMPGIRLWILEHDEKWEIRLTTADRAWR